MKFTLSWLKDHLDTNANIIKIKSTLTNIGLEVETVLDRSEELKPFTVAKVINATKHPNADRLKICEVQTKKGIFKVVCGAHNARSGILAVFAPENTYIPGTDLLLKKTKIRGVESCGMLVSEKEMGISEEHDGIIEIDKKYKIGDSFSKIYSLDDPIIEINITPNRSDCLSVRGVARDLAAAGLGKLKNLNLKKIKGTYKSHIKWQRKFKKDESKLCPGVSGRLFKNVKNSESPEWLKKKLLAIGLRPISALVDITNYITFDLGRPLHVYDADKIDGNLCMRLASKNEKCKTLDEKEYLLSENMVVISDSKKLHGIGGVMGGLDSGCSINTKNVFLEVALFDPISITKTGRKLNLQSDARYRFERGIDTTSIDWGVDKATEMILKLCGGEVSEITSDKESLEKQKIINYDLDTPKKIGGVEINNNNQIKILEKLGFEIKSKTKKSIKIIIPHFRPDIDGTADIFEEIIRIYGYDKIKAISIINNLEIKKEILNDKLKSFYKSKKIISSRGYYETITWSFLPFENANIDTNKNIVKIKNPISNDLDAMRTSVFPNLLESVNMNIGKLYYNGKLFEVGPQFFGVNESEQQMVATGIQYGAAYEDIWSNQKRSSDIFDIKSDLYYFLDQLNIPIEKITYSENTNNFFHPGKSSQIYIGKNSIASFGEIHPSVLQKFEIKTNVYGFEIFLDNISNFQINKSSTRKAYDNNALQSIERDFAFLFPKNVQAQDIIQNIKKIDKEIIKKVSIFDVFEDNKLSVDQKSIALKVILQPLEKTFTDKEIEELSNNIIDNISKSFNGKLRK